MLHYLVWNDRTLALIAALTEIAISRPWPECQGTPQLTITIKSVKPWLVVPRLELSADPSRTANGQQ